MAENPRLRSIAEYIDQQATALANMAYRLVSKDTNDDAYGVDMCLTDLDQLYSRLGAGLDDLYGELYGDEDNCCGATGCSCDHTDADLTDEELDAATNAEPEATEEELVIDLTVEDFLALLGVAL